MPKSAPNPMTLLSRAFGFDPAESQHHFLVLIPRGITQPVQISEHLTWDEQGGSSPVTTGASADGKVRVLLARPKWDAIADEVRAEFNQRLKAVGWRSGVWRLGENLVRRELGKELVLLAWAIEDADPGLIPTAIANWKGLYPEERWWLYTQTAAATGHGINDRGRGWRKAVRFALTENPVIGQVDRTPDFFRRAETQGQMSLLEPNPGYGETVQNDDKIDPMTQPEEPA